MRLLAKLSVKCQIILEKYMERNKVDYVWDAISQIVENWGGPFYKESLLEKAERCKFLAPATADIPRLHCDMGEERKGDCPLYLGRSATCKFFENKMEKNDDVEKD